MIRVEVADKGILEFPDGTEDAVIDQVVKRDFFPDLKPPEPQAKLPGYTGGDVLTPASRDIQDLEGMPTIPQGERVRLPRPREYHGKPSAWEMTKGILGTGLSRTMKGIGAAAEFAGEYGVTREDALDRMMFRKLQEEGKISETEQFEAHPYLKELGKESADFWQKAIEKSTPEEMNQLQQMVHGGLSSAVTMATQLPLAAIHPAIPLATMSVGTGSEEYHDLRAKGISQEKALRAAAATGAVEAITEKIPIRFLTKPGIPFLKRMLGTMISEEVGENIAEGLQLGIHEGTVNPDYTLRQWAQEVYQQAPTVAGQTAIATLALSGGASLVHSQAERMQRERPPIISKSEEAIKKVQEKRGIPVKPEGPYTTPAIGKGTPETTFPTLESIPEEFFPKEKIEDVRQEPTPPPKPPEKAAPAYNWDTGERFKKAPFTEEDLTVLQEVRGIIASTEAGGVPLPEGGRTASQLPEHLKDVGITRTGKGNTLELADRMLRGDQVTRNQYEKISDLVERHRMARGVEPGLHLVEAQNLDVGDKMTIHGEEYKVTETDKSDFPWESRIVVKDGFTYELRGDEEIPIDEGTLTKKGEGFALTAPEVKEPKQKPKQEGLELGRMELRAPEREGKAVTIEETELGKATKETKDRAAQERIPAPKEPWQMTREDAIGEGYIYSGKVTDLALQRQANEWQKKFDETQGEGAAKGLERAKRKLRLANEHKAAIQQALSQGQPVPAEVLKDYPDLKPLPAAAEEATEPLKDFIDKTPKAGLAIADISKQRRVNDDVKMPGDVDFQSVNPEVEDRWQRSKGLTKTGLFNRMVEGMKNIAKLHRTFPELSPKKDARAVNILRQYAAVPEYAKHSSMEITAGMVAGFGPKKYDIFTRNIVLPDIVRDIDSGLLTEDSLPFGYKNRAEVQADLDKFKALAAANPDIQTAIDRRMKFQKALTEELVQQDLLPESVLKDDRYYHHQVLQYMEARRATPGVHAKDVRLKKKGFQKRRKGSSLDYNTEYIESEFEWVAHALTQLKTKETLDKIKAAYDLSDKVKEGEIPDTHVEWQPQPGTVWYKATSVPDRVIEEVLTGTRELTSEDLRTVIAKGQQRKAWIIPENVAKTLDNFRDFSKDEGFDRFVRGTMASWKQWILMNPFRVLKYNFNNMSGDLDISLAYDPKILGELRAAISEVWAHHKGAAMSRDMNEALEYGVITSGITMQEIPEIGDIGLFKVLTSDQPNIIEKYWMKTKALTQARENFLRLAAYKYFKKRVARGDKVYGASVPEQVDALEGNEKAALLARDLIGDYGNISQAGQWLRQRMIPFWSWMEINAPRYVRLMRNASLEGRTGQTGRIAGTVAKKGAFKAAKIVLQANILYGAIIAWNAAMERMIDLDDDERRALYFNRRQLHLILGRGDDGKIRTIRMQGALSDALDWFALGNWPDVIRDITNKRITVKDQLAETAKAPINRVVNASHPVLKTTGEIITGRQIYPDIWKPRPVRDRTEHALRMLSLDRPWRWLTGRPTRGIGEDALSAILYSNDPAERSYWNVKRMTYDFLDKTGVEKPSISPTKKSNALYYFKQAKRFKDEKAAEKYMKRYVELGGTYQGIKRSFQMTAPTGSLNKRQRWQFMKTLSAEERGQVELADQWFNKYMKLTRDDIQEFWNLMREHRRREK